MEFLLVEDDAAIALGLKHLFKHEGYELSIVQSVSDAKKVLSEHHFDLILLDITLPDGLGYDVCTHIRETLKQQTPIIFLTACDEEVNVILGLELGGDDYVTKPFRAKELMARIKTVLRRTTHVSNCSIIEQIVLGDLRIDLKQGKIYKSEQELFLSSIEYKLCLYFMQHPNQVLTREQILMRLFDQDSHFINDNTLSVYIKRLREKIEITPQQPSYLKTIRRVGYKFEVMTEC